MTRVGLLKISAVLCSTALLLVSDAFPSPLPDAWIVFDSNRSGQFDIYKMKPDGSRVTRLTDDRNWDMYPDWSPDGRTIVFARHLPGVKRGQGDIYLMDSDGDNERLLVGEGTYPSFSSDGKAVVFERDRRRIMMYTLSDRQVRQLAPPEGRPFKHLMLQPRLSPDQASLVFVSNNPGQWNVWTGPIGGDYRRRARGCEGTWDPAGKGLLYIAGTSRRGTSIGSFPYPEGKPENYLTLTGTYRHVYFPSLSRDGKYLLFSACPEGQHDHFSANYQIFISPADGSRPVRITWNDFTDRWPKIHGRQAP